MDNALAETGSTASSYQVIAKLATGGMAEIYLARGAGVAGVERYVVMKRVLRDHATDIHFLKMFLDEARLAAQLQHPNIAQVYDVGKLGDSFFFTMEYVHGDTVRAILQRAHAVRRSPPLGCVLAIIAGAAAGLHHAHERIGVDGRPLGIVHRDVSPTNLMVGFDGSVKLVDFGVAKVADRVTDTRSGAVKGKIGYLSPEQARGQRVDRRSDLYALGIVMWEMLTVERLYKRENDFDAMSAIINEPTPPPSQFRRDMPPELDRMVLRMLAKAPEERFQTAHELGEAIEAIAVQTSSPLSAATLSRFMRELFGPRPEPWVAVGEHAKGEVVTVTSEPIPAELRVPTHDPVDRRLADVVDLSADAVGEATSTMFATSRERPLALADGRAHGRWPWFVGAGLVGIAIVIAVAIGARSEDVAPAAKADEPARSVAYSIGALTAPAPVEPAKPDPAQQLVSDCAADPALVTREPVKCTLAACQLHDAAHAQGWLASVTATSRAGVVDACTVAGTRVQLANVASPDTKPGTKPDATKRATPTRPTTTTRPATATHPPTTRPPAKTPTAEDCAADPMACPH